MTFPAFPALLLTLFLLMSGCSRFTTQVPTVRESQTADIGPIVSAQKLQKLGDYAGALKAYQDIMREQPGSDLAATAKYNAAVLRISVDNPQKDYTMALSEFEEFLAQFPQHQRADEARSWRQILKTAIETKKENDRLTKNIEQLKQLDLKQEEKRLGR